MVITVFPSIIISVEQPKKQLCYSFLLFMSLYICPSLLFGIAFSPFLFSGWGIVHLWILRMKC